jgi:antitoxin ParD1/3/4
MVVGVFMATTTMNISLPDSMKSFVEETLDKDGYGTVSEYVRDLIRADQKRREEARLEVLLLQRLDSKEAKFDIKEIKAELAKRTNKKK